MKIEIKILNKEFYEGHDLPSYATTGSAAVDLYCTEDLIIPSGETKMISTGLAIWIKNTDVAGMILPRSGLGNKGLVLANTIGLIDSDYQGELKIAAWNRKSSGENSIILLFAGDRIAQLIFVPIITAKWDIVREFSNKTNRGESGFGSTGV